MRKNAESTALTCVQASGLLADLLRLHGKLPDQALVNAVTCVLAHTEQVTPNVQRLALDILLAPDFDATDRTVAWMVATPLFVMQHYVPALVSQRAYRQLCFFCGARIYGPLFDANTVPGIRRSLFGHRALELCSALVGAGFSTRALLAVIDGKPNFYTSAWKRRIVALVVE